MSCSLDRTSSRRWLKDGRRRIKRTISAKARLGLVLNAMCLCDLCVVWHQRVQSNWNVKPREFALFEQVSSWARWWRLLIPAGSALHIVVPRLCDDGSRCCHPWHESKAGEFSLQSYTHTCKDIDVSLALCSSRHLQAHITVRNALNLSGGGWFDKLDPYAIVRCSSQPSKTQEFAMQVSTQVIRLTPTLINNVYLPLRYMSWGI